MELIEVRSADQLAQVAASDLPAFDAADLRRHSPDAHWILVDKEQRLKARCSLWWNHAPSHPSHRLGVVGHYAAVDAAAGRMILRHACGQLVSQGRTLTVGPMDGNTWRRYRLLIERGSEPTFFLEPDNPDDWPAHFIEEGFHTLASYSSALNTDLSQVNPRIGEIASRLSKEGIRIRAASSDLEQELPGIFAVSAASFANNFLYTPIAEDEFLEAYRKVLPYVRPELVLLAECQGRTIGFLFALPDLLQARRGQPVDTVIIKTVAVAPDKSSLGLGGLLVARAQQAARELGYRRAIHALMHESNVSRNISHRYAATIRRYALFAKPLVS